MIRFPWVISRLKMFSPTPDHLQLIGQTVCARIPRVCVPACTYTHTYLPHLYDELLCNRMQQQDHVLLGEYGQDISGNFFRILPTNLQKLVSIIKRCQLSVSCPSTSSGRMTGSWEVQVHAGATHQSGEDAHPVLLNLQGRKSSYTRLLLEGGR